MKFLLLYAAGVAISAMLVIRVFDTWGSHVWVVASIAGLFPALYILIQIKNKKEKEAIKKKGSSLPTGNSAPEITQTAPKSAQVVSKEAEARNASNKIEEPVQLKSENNAEIPVSEERNRSSDTETPPNDAVAEVDFDGFGSTTMLVLAIQNNQLPTIKELVEAGKVNIKDELRLDGGEGLTILHPLSMAVDRGYIDIVDYLLSNEANPNHGSCDPDAEVMPPLAVAVSNAPNNYPIYIPIIKLLLDAGAEVNPKVDGEKPLILLAAEKGSHPEIMNMIINSGLDLDFKGQGPRALMAVASVNDPSAIRLIVTAGGSVNVANKKSGVTPLHIAAFEGSKEAAEALVELGADVSHQTHDGRTAIDFAEMENQQLVKIFLSGQIRHADSDESLPSTEEVAKYLEVLMSTISQDSPDDLKFFFENDVPGINEYEFGTALYMAASSGSLDTLTLLLKKGISPNLLRVSQRNGMGNSPLHQAIMFFNNAPEVYLKILKLLVEYGAFTNVADMVANDEKYEVREIGLLNLVVAQGLPSDIIRLLFDTKIDKKEFNQGVLALLDAASKEYPEIVRELVGGGVPVDGANEKGVTALHRAAYYGQLDVAHILIELGANASRKESEGLNAAELARQQGYNDLCAFLSDGSILPTKMPALETAIHNNDFSKVKELVASGNSDVNKQWVLDEDKGHITGGALHMAVDGADVNLDLVEYLLSKGANPNLIHVGPEYSLTLLKRAVFKVKHNPENYIKAIQMLITAGADVNAEKDVGTPLLRVAVEEGCYPEIIRSLLEAGLDEDEQLEWRLLEYMATNNKYEAIPILVNARIHNPVNDYSSEGITLLHQAAYCGSLEAARALVASGADVTFKDKNGNSAVSLAKQQGHDDVCSFIIECLEALAS